MNHTSGDATVLFFVSLKLSVDLVTRACEECWQRIENVEKDWLFVEDLEDDDVLSNGKTGGALEVGQAATAARNRKVGSVNAVFV